MNKHLTRLLLIVFLLTACGPAVLPSPPTATATQTITPSRTPRPTQTAIPTATPYPSLQTQGPHLLFTYDNKNFTIMDADGSGRRQFQLPNNGYIFQLDKSVSPDGKWLAYFTGSTEEPYDLTLHIFSLEDGNFFSITKLLAQGFPQNLENTANLLQFDDCEDGIECKLNAFRLSLIDGIKTFKWSPNNQYLAFAAQIDGSTSDIYLYNIEDKSLRQLTNELANIYRINWSPGGGKILYDTSTQGGKLFLSTRWHIVDFQTGKEALIKDLQKGSPWQVLGWGNEKNFYIATGSEGPILNIRSINTETSTSRDIWLNTAESIVLDPPNNQFILSSYPSNPPGVNTGITPGTYLLDFDSSYKKISDEIYIFIEEQNSSDSYFAVGKSGLVNVSQNGSITYVAENTPKINTLNVSANNNWFIVTRETVVELFSGNMKLYKTWDIDSSRTTWNPDSTKIFLYSKKKLYYIDIPDEEPTLLDTCQSHDCFFNYTWLP